MVAATVRYNKPSAGLAVGAPPVQPQVYSQLYANMIATKTVPVM